MTLYISNMTLYISNMTTKFLCMTQIQHHHEGPNMAIAQAMHDFKQTSISVAHLVLQGEIYHVLSVESC